jgi:hypothetical protein
LVHLQIMQQHMPWLSDTSALIHHDSVIHQLSDTSAARRVFPDNGKSLQPEAGCKKGSNHPNCGASGWLSFAPGHKNCLGQILFRSSAISCWECVYLSVVKHLDEAMFGVCNPEPPNLWGRHSSPTSLDVLINYFDQFKFYF